MEEGEDGRLSGGYGTAHTYTASMGAQNKLEQEIAIFGESGSGKTVLLSSFFGATEDPAYGQEHSFEIVADDIGQGHTLRQNYLGMERDAKVPIQTIMTSHSYSFTVTPKRSEGEQGRNRRPFKALRLVWHDYPGDWFEQSTSGATESQRRVDTFRKLLGSDVAVLLVDGQKLKEYQDEEERYLKSLFGSFRSGLATLRDQVLEDGKLLVDFPRIWVIALSKADVLPDMDVQNFKDLMIYKAAQEIAALRQEIAKFIHTKEALSVGDDFLLLSSAKFEPGAIHVEERIGIDLLLPLAAILPFERLLRWESRMQLPRKVAASLMGGAAPTVAYMLLNKVRLPGPFGIVQRVVAGFLSRAVIEEAMGLAKEKLAAANKAATERKDYLTATLTGFKMALERGEDNGVLLRSKR